MDEPPHDDPLTPPSTSAPATATTDQAVLDLDEEAAVRSRVSPHRRAAQTGIVLAVVLVVVGLLLHSLGPAPRGTASLLPSPTPAPSTVVIMSNVTFGTLTVNGHTLQGAPPLVTHLFHVGTNVVTLTAPPFEAHACRFLFPSEQPSSSETGCEVSGYSGTFDVGGATVAPDELVDIGLSDTDLPPDLAASAVGVVTQAVTAVPLHTVVPAGQYYATGSDAHGHIAARRAVTPVQAAVLNSLTPPSTSGFCGGQQQLCGATLFPGLALPADQQLWLVAAGVTMTWRFTTPSGSVTVTPGLSLPNSVPVDALVQVLLAYHGATPATAPDTAPSWSVVTLPAPALGSGPTILPMPDQLTTGLCTVGYGVSVPYDQGVEGCEIDLLQGGPNGPVQGTFLWRFAVLFAVDKGAHTLASWLPIAPQAEVAAVEG